MAAQPQSQLEILLRVADIVDLTGVGGSAVVTNWRARSPKFPVPRIGGSQPLFELEEILEWLRFDGPRGRPVVEPTAEWRWPRLVEAFFQQADTVDVSDRRAALVALVTIRHLLARDRAWRAVVGAPDPVAALRAAATAAEDVAARRATTSGVSLRDQLVRRVDLDATAAALLVEVAATLDQYEAPFETHLTPVLDLEASSQRRRPQRTDPVLARLVAALGQVRKDSTVYDPAVGEGDALVAAAELANDRVRVVGRDISPEASFIASARLAVRSCAAVVLEPGDSLRSDREIDGTHSVVLLDPPVSDRSTSTEGHSLNRWLDHALDRLKERGRVVVVLPLHELAMVRAARRRPDQRLQSMLMKTFVTHPLHAVVVLPRGYRPDVVGPLAVLAMHWTGAAHGLHDDEPVEVPVFVVDDRGRPDPRSRDKGIDAASELAHAFATMPASEVDPFDIDFVHRIDTPIDRLWSTLDGLVEAAEPSRSSSSSSRSSRRSAPPPDAVESIAPPSARDELASMMEHADALSVLRSPVSRNSWRLAAFESPSMRSDLMWEREAVRVAGRSERSDVDAATRASAILQAITDAQALVRALAATAGTDPSDETRRVQEIIALLDRAVEGVESLGGAPTVDRTR